MIYSDREIAAAIRHGQISIEPSPDESLWTSTALDLTLDDVIVRWREPEGQPTGAPLQPLQVYPAANSFNVRAMSEDDKYAEKIPISRADYPLKPGEFILGYTKQLIRLPHASRVAARVEGKSSLARLGVGVHVTAPTIHAGFGARLSEERKRGPSPGIPIQLEIFNLGPFEVFLKAGMPICQLILEEVRETPIKGYAGKFSTQESFKLASPEKPAKSKRSRN